MTENTVTTERAVMTRAHGDNRHSDWLITYTVKPVRQKQKSEEVIYNSLLRNLREKETGPYFGRSLSAVFSSILPLKGAIELPAGA